jgi:DNA-3-methyladenine glycosylase I
MTQTRCDWSRADNLMMAYHDTEWGVPLYDDHQLFEFLILEGMQAGLSWATILKKRVAFRAAFADFNAEKIVQFSSDDMHALMQNKAIVRNKLKIAAVIHNAKAFLDLKTQISFSDFLWQFVDGVPKINYWEQQTQVPAYTAESEAMEKALKQAGFKFVGRTICYAFMQATGMVNDHMVSCYRYQMLLNSE